MTTLYTELGNDPVVHTENGYSYPFDPHLDTYSYIETLHWHSLFQSIDPHNGHWIYCPGNYLSDALIADAFENKKVLPIPKTRTHSMTMRTTFKNWLNANVTGHLNFDPNDTHLTHAPLFSSGGIELEFV